jgi:hypothetical protein
LNFPSGLLPAMPDFYIDHRGAHPIRGAHHGLRIRIQQLFVVSSGCLDCALLGTGLVI